MAPPPTETPPMRCRRAIRVLGLLLSLGVVLAFVGRTGRLAYGWNWQARCWRLALSADVSLPDRFEYEWNVAERRLKACRSYLQRHTSWRDDPRLAAGAAWIFGGPENKRAEASRVRKAIERAAELESKNPRWWRSLALTTMLNSSGSRQTPLHDDWPEILQRCRRHDPDNALYDYLEAIGWWSLSTTTEDWFDEQREESFTRIKKHDSEKHQRALRCMAKGLTRTKLDRETDWLQVIDEASMYCGTPPFDRHITLGHFSLSSRYRSQASSLWYYRVEDRPHCDG